MKIQVVRFTYEAGIHDACRGYRRSEETARGIVVPRADENSPDVFVLDRMGEPHFFAMTKEGRGYKFSPPDLWTPLPEQGYEVVREVEINDEVGERIRSIGLHAAAYQRTLGQCRELFGYINLHGNPLPDFTQELAPRSQSAPVPF